MAAAASSRAAAAERREGGGGQEGAMYELALQHARARDYDQARGAFEELLAAHPHADSKPWISYAQMAKKSAGRIGLEAGRDACRSVLQRGLQAMPDDGRLVQAAGLLELEAGQPERAVALLQRAVALQPELAPVLQWAPVRKHISSASAG